MLSINKNRRRNRCRRRGAAAVECAVVAPLIVLIVFASIQVGQLIHISRTVCDASREGARQAASPRVETVAEVEAAVAEYLNNAFSGVPPQTVRAATEVFVRRADGTTITDGNLTSVASGTKVSVEVRFDSTRVRWSTDRFNVYGNILKTTSVMRRQ